jgi:aldehyde:ferredoxin oxidoreductase
VETPPETFYRIYPGAGLIGTYYLLRDTPPGLDPFDPESLLVFSSSVIGGNLGPGLAKFGVVGKSPLSGGVFDSRGEGPFARGLKGTGYDALVIRGRIEKPGYLLIDGGRLSFHPAEALWGRNTSETGAVLEERHGPGAYVASIGQAGENLVRFATIVTAGSHPTHRGGLGAVMGSKNLKAVVVRNPISPEVADPDAIAALDKLFREDGLPNNALNRWQKDPAGISYWLDIVVDPGYAALRNFQSHDYTMPEGFRRDLYLSYYRGPSECTGCANDCIKRFNTRRLTPDDRAGGIDYEAIGIIAMNLELQAAETFLDVNTQCNLYGLDPVSLGGVLGFAAECVEKGALSREDLGFDFGFGKADKHVVDLVEQIAFRKGAGATLAEGVRRAARSIGKGSEAYAMHVKGVELTYTEVRCQTNLGLGFALAPNGPQGDICEHDWDFDTVVGWTHTLERTGTLGIFERVPMAELSPEKVKNFKVLNTIWSACDGINLCPFVSAPTRYFRLSQMVRLVAAVTGWDFSGYEFMRIGERRNTLMRCYNYREGLTADDDRLPDRLYEEPIRSGRHQGARIDRAKFREMLNLHYTMAGWDAEGRPERAKLVDLNLGWIAGAPSQFRAT